MLAALTAAALALSAPTGLAPPTDAELNLCAMVVAGEARSLRSDTQLALIVHVAANRALARRQSLVDVLADERQFQALDDRANRQAITAPGFEETPAYARAHRVCSLTLDARADGAPDPTGGAGWYYHGPAVPWWARCAERERVGATTLVKKPTRCPKRAAKKEPAR